MGSAGCRAARLKSQSAKDHLLQNRRRHLLPPSGVAPGARFDLLSGWSLGRFELGAVSQHGVHDDGETTGSAPWMIADNKAELKKITSGKRDPTHAGLMPMRGYYGLATRLDRAAPMF
jgi:hypothetical protein